MNFFTQIKESVIDFKYYLKVKDNKFSSTFSYFIMLFLIIYAMGATKTYVDFSRGVALAISSVENNVADFRLEEGIFTYEGNMPLIVQDGSSNVFALDTTGNTGESILNDKKSGLLITKEAVFYKDNAQYRKFYFKDIPNFTLSKSDLTKFMDKLPMFFIIVAVIGFLFVFAIKLLNAVFLALIGMLINSTFKTDVGFRELFNISIYALTLPLLLQLAVGLSGMIVPGFNAIYWLVSVVYVTFALKSYRDSKNIKLKDESI